MHWEIGIDISILLCVKSITNENILSAVRPKWKEIQEEWIWVYVGVIHCALE